MNILITGAVLPASIGLVRLLGRAGHRVVLAGCAWWATGRYSRYVTRYVRLPSPRFEPAAFADAIEAIVTADAIDLVIPCFEEVFYLASVMDALGLGDRLFAPRLEVLETLHDKHAFIELARQHGLPHPETHRIENLETLTALLSTGDGWVLKPVHSRFSENVFFDPSAADVAGLDISGQRPWVLQERLGGRQTCTYSVVHDGRVTAHAAYRSLLSRGAGASVACESVTDDASREWVATLVGALGFRGQISFDFIEDDDGTPRAIECNPRATTGAFFLLGVAGAARAFEPGGEALFEAPAGEMIVNRLVASLMALESRENRAERVRIQRINKACSDYYYSRDDPAPWLWRFVGAAGVFAQARRQGMSLEELTTRQTIYTGRGG